MPTGKEVKKMEQEQKKILIVDDEPAMREAGSRMLKRRLYANIATVDNGEDAIESVRAISYDLILLDLKIPKRNGWEVLEEIRKFNTKIKILVITGVPQFTKEQQEIINNKTSGVFHKPIVIEKVVKRIAEILGASVAIDPVCILPDNLKGRPEAREIVHALNGIHGSIRISCDEYFYLLEHGHFNTQPHAERIEYLAMILRDVIDNIKRASDVVEKIRKL